MSVIVLLIKSGMVQNVYYLAILLLYIIMDNVFVLLVLLKSTDNVKILQIVLQERFGKVIQTHVNQFHVLQAIFGIRLHVFNMLKLVQ